MKSAKTLALALFMLSLFAPTGAHARYPEKPVRIIVPYSVGGSSDAIARAIGDELGKALGQVVIVENRAGAGSMQGTQYVASEAADGYTLLLADVPFTIVPALYKERARYDTRRDFAPVALLGVAPMYLFVNADFAAKSAPDLTRMAKAAPGTVSIGSGGNGSLTHLMAELFMTNTGTKLVHIPYKGAAAAATDLASGQINASFSTMASALSLYKAGRLRAIAVGSAQRRKDTPDVPTFTENGIPNMAVESWWGLMMPAGTSLPVRDTMTAAMFKVMQSPNVKARLISVGVSAPADSSAAALQGVINADLARWQEVVQRANIKLD